MACSEMVGYGIATPADAEFEYKNSLLHKVSRKN